MIGKSRRLQIHLAVRDAIGERAIWSSPSDPGMPSNFDSRAASAASLSGSRAN